MGGRVAEEEHEVHRGHVEYRVAEESHHVVKDDSEEAGYEQVEGGVGYGDCEEVLEGGVKPACSFALERGSFLDLLPELRQALQGEHDDGEEDYCHPFPAEGAPVRHELAQPFVFHVYWYFAEEESHEDCEDANYDGGYYELLPGSRLCREGPSDEREGPLEASRGEPRPLGPVDIGRGGIPDSLDLVEHFLSDGSGRERHDWGVKVLVGVHGVVVGEGARESVGVRLEDVEEEVRGVGVRGEGTLEVRLKVLNGTGGRTEVNCCALVEEEEEVELVEDRGAGLVD